MISCFLTQEHGWDVAAAAIQFAAARPPGIYKPHYLRELYEKFDEDVAHIVTPELPSWHADDEDDEPGPGGTKRRREDLDFNYGSVPREPEQLTMTGVHGEIGRLVEGAEMEDVRRRCIEYCHGRSSQFPGAQPISLDRTTMQQFRYEPFLVSWKADGTRYLMLILRHAVYMVDRNFRVSASTA